MHGWHRLAIPLLVFLWLGGFALSLDAVLVATPYSPIVISPAAGPEAYPQVVRFKTGLGDTASQLSAGDSLVALDGLDLRGAGFASWGSAVAQQEPPGDQRVTVRFSRHGEEGETTLRLGSHRRFWPRLVASLTFAACAFVLAGRLRSSALVLNLIYANLAFALLFACTFSGSPTLALTGLAFSSLGLAIGPPAMLRAFLMLPAGARSPNGWARYGPWTLSAYAPLNLCLFLGGPKASLIGAYGFAVLSVAATIATAMALERSYRVCDAIGRRQIRWVLLGLYLALVPISATLFIAILHPETLYLSTVSVALVGVLPAAILIAITRYNCLDVDRLWSHVALATAMGVVGIAAVLFVVPPVVERISHLVGLQRQVLEAGVVLLLAGAIVPFRGHFRALLDQAFFSDQRALEEQTATLIRQLSDCETPAELTDLAGDGVMQLLELRSCVLHTRVEERFSPAFIRGNVRTANFASSSPLVASLAQQGGPLALDEEVGAGRGLGSFQRAVLETLGVPAVVPVRRRGSLVAFMSLGTKRSGDVYTATDLTLLALVADKVASELLRFDQSEMLAASRTLQEKLRRYVPEPLAEQLDRGELGDLGEMEVSVLFVDIRGYSGLVEPLAPDEIHTTVNRYTVAVSEVIRDHGGTVVEFSGDGLMAVFGAPGVLPAKEEKAVAAGRAVVERVPSLAGAVGTLSVGVGVATGVAFVGNVQSVDRQMWTALGNTTNLASRLQSMTRDLGASMVIDEATWRQAGSHGSHFLPLEAVAIRGRKRPENLYLLPNPTLA